MFNRTSLVRTAQVLSIGAVATLASATLATPASAATMPVACSQSALQNAVTAANATPGGATLSLAPRCVYQLTSELPAITSQVVVDGNRATITRQSGTFRILTVDGGDLTLGSTVVSNGDATDSAVRPGAGGGIVVTGNGALTVNSSVIRDNHADFGGGVSVFSGSRAQFNSSTVTGNSAATAAQNGGGTSTVTASSSPGGIYNNGGTVTLLQSRVAANTPSNCANSPTAVPGCVG
jgi:hypothetical protein